MGNETGIYRPCRQGTASPGSKPAGALAQISLILIKKPAIKRWLFIPQTIPARYEAVLT